LLVRAFREPTKEKKISRTHVRIIVRVFGVVGEFKKRITRLDTSLSLFWALGYRLVV
jgi:hypothetical protein